jgi:hypothetical protein
VIKYLMPSPAATAAKQVRNRLQALMHRGTEVACPLCERTFARFLPSRGRPMAICPGCRSMERHRMFWLFFERRTELFEGPVRVLHFAPEAHLEKRLRALPSVDYVSADLIRTDVDVRVDVTKIDLPDESFDVVLCSHVLEHVPDDRLAMRELLRITRRDGWALLTTPVSDDLEDTFEDWNLTTAAERTAAFGQEDHVRLYGRNFPDLLREQGWEVDVTPMSLSSEESRLFGIPPAEQRLYLGRRPHAR